MEIAIHDETGDKTITDILAIQKICDTLMKVDRYKQMGPSAIELIVCRARAIGMHPLEALNGGLHCVKGKVEMSAQMMNSLIRQAGHSITQLENTNSKCVLKGRRKDSGDEFVCSFSIDDAKNAGLTSNPTWRSYPRSMLFARALSLLARQLFPDVIRDCYVHGEIDTGRQFSPALVPEAEYEEERKVISAEQVAILDSFLDKVPEFRERAMEFLSSHYMVDKIEDIPPELYDRILAKAKQEVEKL